MSMGPQLACQFHLFQIFSPLSLAVTNACDYNTAEILIKTLLHFVSCAIQFHKTNLMFVLTVSIKINYFWSKQIQYISHMCMSTCDRWWCISFIYHKVPLKRNQQRIHMTWSFYINNWRTGQGKYSCLCLYLWLRSIIYPWMYQVYQAADQLNFRPPVCIISTKWGNDKRGEKDEFRNSYA